MNNLSLGLQDFRNTNIEKGFDVELEKGFSETPDKKADVQEKKQPTVQDTHASDVESKKLALEHSQKLDKQYQYSKLSKEEQRAMRVLVNIDGKSAKEKLQTVMDHFGVSRVGAINLLADATKDISTNNPATEDTEETGEIAKAFNLDGDYLEKGRAVPIGTINKYGEVKTAEGWKFLKKEHKGEHHDAAIEHAKKTNSLIEPGHEMHPDSLGAKKVGEPTAKTGVDYVDEAIKNHGDSQQHKIALMKLNEVKDKLSKKVETLASKREASSSNSAELEKHSKALGIVKEHIAKHEAASNTSPLRTMSKYLADLGQEKGKTDKEKAQEIAKKYGVSEREASQAIIDAMDKHYPGWEKKASSDKTTADTIKSYLKSNKDKNPAEIVKEISDHYKITPQEASKLLSEASKSSLSDFIDTLPKEGNFKVKRNGKLSSAVYDKNSFKESLKSANLEPNSSDHGFEGFEKVEDTTDSKKKSLIQGINNLNSLPKGKIFDDAKSIEGVFPKSKHSYSEVAQAFEENRDKSRVQEVDLKDIHITQPNIQSKKVEKMVNDLDKTPTLNVVQFPSGEKAVFDGHHRLTSNWVAGNSKVKVNLVKLDDK